MLLHIGNFLKSKSIFHPNRMLLRSLKKKFSIGGTLHAVHRNMRIHIRQPAASSSLPACLGPLCPQARFPFYYGNQRSSAFAQNFGVIS